MKERERGASSTDILAVAYVNLDLLPHNLGATTDDIINVANITSRNPLQSRVIN